jgi:hypothetical protein
MHDRGATSIIAPRQSSEIFVTASATTAPANDIARGVLQELGPEKLVLTVPGTNYRLHLTPGIPVANITTPIGKRIKGRIHANALRLFKADSGGGGQFIEPIWGQPRIIAGLVQHVDAANRRMLIEAAVPMWLTVEADQRPDLFVPGDMVNGYIQSGATFTPA